MFQWSMITAAFQLIVITFMPMLLVVISVHRCHHDLIKTYFFDIPGSDYLNFLPEFLKYLNMSPWNRIEINYFTISLIDQLPHNWTIGDQQCNASIIAYRGSNQASIYCKPGNKALKCLVWFRPAFRATLITFLCLESIPNC